MMTRGTPIFGNLDMVLLCVIPRSRMIFQFKPRKNPVGMDENCSLWFEMVWFVVEVHRLGDCLQLYKSGLDSILSFQACYISIQIWMENPMICSHVFHPNGTLE